MEDRELAPPPNSPPNFPQQPQQEEEQEEYPPEPFYPYLAMLPEQQLEINREVSALLEEIDDMLYDIARKRLRGIADEDTVQEMVQQCRQWLWQHSLPKYDATLGFKQSTFLNKCAKNYFEQEIRSMRRRRKSKHRTIHVDPDVLREALPYDGGYLDNKIATIVDDFLANPRKFLTASQVKVFLAVTNNPDVPMKVLARQLGYKLASSLSTMKRRIRERITQISVEDYEPD
ncbi:MAG: hypothetical protein FWD53_12180 [Phycisphaerales bacterium]|nr:hypothetical protein [Phycisphaerales bacterium]